MKGDANCAKKACRTTTSVRIFPRPAVRFGNGRLRSLYNAKSRPQTVYNFGLYSREATACKTGGDAQLKHIQSPGKDFFRKAKFYRHAEIASERISN